MMILMNVIVAGLLGLVMYDRLFGQKETVRVVVKKR